MVKQKKKRNKKYRGSDAASTRPVVTKITAANRSRIAQQLYEKRLWLKPIGTLLLVIIVIILIVSGIISLL